MKQIFFDEMIHLQNLRVECIIGVRPHERENTQPLLISLSMKQDFSKAAESEDLSATVDYSEVAKVTRAFVIEGRFMLLETLIRKLALHLAGHFGLKHLHLDVQKPNVVPDSDGPKVSLTYRAEEEN